MTPAVTAPRSRAKAGCGVAITVTANAAMAARVITFNMFYPFNLEVANR